MVENVVQFSRNIEGMPHITFFSMFYFNDFLKFRTISNFQTLHMYLKSIEELTTLM